MYSKFKQHIINLYGSKGKKWLLDLPNITSLIAKKWHLTDLKPVANLSINYVASG
jgi:streptomycin 6-kinase